MTTGGVAAASPRVRRPPASPTPEPRGEVTGGQHLNAFCELVCDVVRLAGFDGEELRFRAGVELPGYNRPQKKRDMVVIRENRLCAALEMKSQVGPSFGNNFNNRSEEAIGSSADS